MVSRLLRALLLIGFCTLATSCTAASGSLVETVHQNAGATVIVRLILPPRAATHRRLPTFISPDTLGVTLSVTGSASVSQSINIAPGASACGGNSGSPRICQSSLPVPAGSYTLVATTYDQAPVGGVMNGSAHALASGTVSGITIVTGTSNMTTIYVGGIVTAYGNSTYLSLAGNGVPQQVGFAMNPQDYDAESIIAGPNDPLHNPITFTLSEAGGSGHESIIKNGVNVGLSASMTKSSDVMQISYDGGGAAGYSGNVVISASGVAATTVYISPEYVIPGGANGQSTAIRFTSPGQTSTLAITEAHAPASVTYTVTASAGCSGVATTSAVTGSGASATDVVTAGSTVSNGGCTLSVTDSLGTSSNIAIAVSAIHLVHHGGLTASPRGLTVGPDGNLWFTEYTGIKIGTMNATTFAVQEFTAGLTSGPRSITSGPDGNLWFTEDTGNRIGRINPTTHVISEYSTGITAGALPTGITTGSDGNLWFTESAANALGTINPTTHVITQYPAGNSQLLITSGPDGNLWFTKNSSDQISRMNITTHVVTNIGVLAGAGPFGITIGPDNNLWVTEAGGNRLAVVNPTTLAVTPHSTGISGGSQPLYITAGLDNDLWFSEPSANQIAAFNPTTYAVQEYPLPAGTGPYAIVTLGGDMWFSENSTTKLGQLTAQ